jgi:hypothetical protein
MSYIDKYNISAEKLAQQFVETDIRAVNHANYAGWMKKRAQRLADEGNAFLKELSEGLSTVGVKAVPMQATGDA